MRHHINDEDTIMGVDMPSQTSSCSSEYSYHSSATYTSGFDGSYSNGPLKQEMDGHIQEVEVEKLVKVSFGLTDEEVTAIKRATWTLPQEPLEKDNSKVRAGAPTRHQYQYIQAILEGVVTQLEEGKPGFDVHRGDHSTAIFYVEMDGTRCLKVEGSSRGPDGWLGWTRKTKFGWNTIKAALEIKVTRDKDVKQESPKPSKGVLMKKTASESSAMALRKSSASTSAAASTSMASRHTVVSAGAKRQRVEAEDSQAIGLPNKKIRTPSRRGLSNKTIRPALYALECLASGCRRWTFGLSFDNYTVMLWYFDRMGAIRSVEFEFNLEAHTWKLALILAGLYRCTPAQAGFEPLIVSPRATINTQTHWPIFDLPLSNFANAEVVVPRSINQPTAGDKRYRVDNEELLYTSWGIIGRGTTVIPVRPLSSTGNNGNCLLVVKISLPSLICPVLESTLTRRLRQRLGFMRKHLPKIVQARVFSLMHMNYPRFSLGLLVEEHRRFTLVVMRRYRPLWEITSLEDFKNVFVDLVECHYHAFKVGRVLHRDLSENNLMWTYEGEGDSGKDGDEVYNTFQAECEGRDWEDERRIAEEGDIEKASMDVKKHHQDGKRRDEEISNEDISQLNYDLTEGPPTAGPALNPAAEPAKAEVPPVIESTRNTQQEPNQIQKAIGILTDWDLGSLVHEDDMVDWSMAKHRTGTRPFMARDLLKQDPLPHLYRHDLESFFYVLIWAMVHYDLKGTRRCTKDGSTHPIISDWESCIDTNRKAKDSIFSMRENLGMIMACVQLPLRPLIQEWIYPLRRMFVSGFRALDAHNESEAPDEHPQSIPTPKSDLDLLQPPPSDVDESSVESVAGLKVPTFDMKTLGGHVTFEAFMCAIRRTPRAIPSKLTNSCRS